MLSDPKIVRTLSVALVGSFVGFLVTVVFWVLAVHGASILGSESLAEFIGNLLAASFSVPIAIYVARSPTWRSSHKIIVITMVGFGSIMVMIADFISQVAAGTWILWPATVITIVATVLWFSGFWFWVIVGLKMAMRRQQPINGEHISHEGL